jgi:cobalt-zinc-cadmium efflux system protein
MTERTGSALLEQHDPHDDHVQDGHSHDDHARDHAARGDRVEHASASRGHDHSGHHHHAHTFVPSRAFAFGILLNLGFVAVETTYGLLANSMALVADAGHNLSDVLGLGLSWGTMALARRRPTERHTYGLRGSTILASLGNALTLLFVTGGVAWESVRRLTHPAGEIGVRTVIVVALLGVAVNATSALALMRGRGEDLNVRSSFYHLASDAALALGVATTGVAILFTGWNWLDPIVSIALSIVILVGTWSLFKKSLDLALHAVPEGIDPRAVRTYLAAVPGVENVHDLHIWAMSTTETALTAHLIVTDTAARATLLSDICAELRRQFRIHHATLQLEAPEMGERCDKSAESHVCT